MEKFLMIFTGFLIVSFILSELFYRLKYPRVMGQIIAGIIIGLPLFSGLIFPQGGFSAALASGQPSAVLIDMLSDLGIIFILLLVGLEINYTKLKTLSYDVLAIAALTILVPFAAGYYLMQLMGYPSIISLVVGAALAITAEGTTAMVLMELDKLNTKLGEIVLAAGVLDDLFGVVFLSMLLVFVPGNTSPDLLNSLGLDYSSGDNILIPFMIVLLELFVFVTLSFVMFRVFPPVIRYIQSEKSESTEFMTVLLGGLFIAVLSELLGLGTIIGAFIAGLIIQHAIGNKMEEEKMVEDLKLAGLSLFIPFFFIHIGLHFDLSSLFSNPLVFLLILSVALAGKIISALIAKPFTDLSWQQLYLVGWCMNSRGAVGLVIAGMSYSFFVEAGALDVFSSIVAMTALTTLILPLVLKYEISRHPSIMS